MFVCFYQRLSSLYQFLKNKVKQNKKTTSLVRIGQNIIWGFNLHLLDYLCTIFICFSAHLMIAIYLAGICIEKKQDRLKIKSRMHWPLNPMHIEITWVVSEEIDIWFWSSNVVDMTCNAGISSFKKLSRWFRWAAMLEITDLGNFRLGNVCGHYTTGLKWTGVCLEMKKYRRRNQGLES